MMKTNIAIVVCAVMMTLFLIRGLCFLPQDNEDFDRDSIKSLKNIGICLMFEIIFLLLV